MRGKGDGGSSDPGGCYPEGGMIFGLIHGFMHRWLSRAWPPGIRARGLRFAVLVFVLSYVFWEFFTRFNQFGEPLRLLALELGFWVTIALTEGFVIALVIEWRRGYRWATQ